MRSTLVRLALLLVTVVMAATACTTAQPPSPPPVDQAAIGATIDSLSQAFFAAASARDSNAVAAFYADDAHFLPSNQPRVDGRDGIRHAWAEFLSLPELVPSVTPNTKIISESGDQVVDLGTYTMTWKQNGKDMTDTGKYVTVFKKVGGEWKIVVDTFNSDLPIPGQ